MKSGDSFFGTESGRMNRLVARALDDSDAEESAAAVTSLDMVLEQPGSQIDRYRLLQALGEGGMGVVYLAEQTEPIHRKVALKIIKLGMDTRKVIARFEAERQALALMDHPNIARVLDAGATQTGRPYFIMELMTGIPITECCDKNRLSTQDRLALFLQVCSAAQHAHTKGIIHRDIKPSNVLVTLVDGTPVPKIIDFGIAKATDQRMTEKTLFTCDGHIIGTPVYMSPEQAGLSEMDIDTRSDIYSLGVPLYVLLAGILPYDSQTFHQGGIEHIRKVIRETDPKTPSTRLTKLGEEAKKLAESRRTEVATLAKRLHTELEWIPLKAMRKERAERYRSASEFADDIENYLKAAPLMAGPLTAGYRLHKFLRRNKRVFAGVAVVAAVLVLGVIVSTWQAVRATRAEREQSRLREDAVAAQEKETALRRQVQAEAYASSMNLAQQAWEQNNIGRLRQLLEETATYTGRGFEWYYWQREAHLESRTLRGHFGWIVSVAFSPDGQRIVTGNYDQMPTVWDTTSAKGLLTIRGHVSRIVSVAFSPDGQRIVTGSSRFSVSGRTDYYLSGDDQTTKVWEGTGGRELLSLKGHGAGIWSVSFSADGQRIVTGSYDKTAKVWQAASPHQVDAWQQEEEAAKERLEVVRREWDAVVERDRALARPRPRSTETMAYPCPDRLCWTGWGHGSRP